MKTQYGKMSIEIVGGKARLVRGGANALAADKATNAYASKSRPVANPAPAPLYDSQTEAQWANELAVLLRLGVVLFIQHHPFTLALPGGVLYTPDFLVVRLVDGRTIVQIDEVKGWSKNVRDGVTRWKIAAGLMPWFEWRLIRRVKRRWSVTVHSNGRR